MHWSKTVDDSDYTPIASLVTLPTDLLLAIFVPDATRLAIGVEHASIRSMIDLYMWRRMMQNVASDVCRLRIVASTDRMRIDVANSHAVVRYHLRILNLSRKWDIILATPTR